MIRNEHSDAQRISYQMIILIVEVYAIILNGYEMLWKMYKSPALKHKSHNAQI